MSEKWSLRTLLGSRKAPDSGMQREIRTEIGDFKIDLARRTAMLRDQDLFLSSEEFDVLVFLASHPQRLVTPHTVLATNWDAHQLRQTDFLKALISLRKKLDAANPGKHYLRTEPWVVYRFDPAASSAM